MKDFLMFSAYYFDRKVRVGGFTMDLIPSGASGTIAEIFFDIMNESKECCLYITNKVDDLSGWSGNTLKYDFVSSEYVSNNSPTIKGVAKPYATKGRFYSFKPKAKDADGDKLTFSIKNKPRWAEFHKKTGKLKGRPAKHAVSSKGIEISVSDGKCGITSLPPFNIKINHPPTITGRAKKKAKVGKRYLFKAKVKDKDGDKLTFSIKNKPDWIKATLSKRTGNLKLWGKPKKKHVGTTKKIVITVKDGKGGKASLPPFKIKLTDY